MPVPRLTVAIPAKDSEKYLRQALDSVLGQRFGDFRLVVAENASSDGTVDILAEYARRDKRLAYFCEPEPLGHTPNFNRTVHLCQSPWIKFLCHDDLIRSDCLAQTDKAIDHADENNVSLISNPLRLMFDDGKVTKAVSGMEREFYRGSEAIRMFMNGVPKPLMPNVSNCAVRKEALARVGGFDNRFQHQDITAWTKVLASANLFYLPDTLTIVRIHAQQNTHTADRTGHTVRDYFTFFEEFTQAHGKELGITPGELRRTRMRALSSSARLAMESLGKGNAREALSMVGFLPWSMRALVPAAALRVAWKERRRQKAMQVGITAYDPVQDDIPAG